MCNLKIPVDCYLFVDTLTASQNRGEMARFTLDETQDARRQLEELLVRHEIYSDCIDQLFVATLASLDVFDEAILFRPEFRKTHDELRKLWRKCAISKPIKRDVRTLAFDMSEEAFNTLRPRGEYLFPKLTGLEFSRENFQKWLSKAKKRELTITLMRLIDEGTQILEGHKYPDGARARKRREPQILGYVRRGKNSWRPVGGYAHTEASNDLIRNLAADFYGSIAASPFADTKHEQALKEYLSMALSWIEMELPRDRLTQLRNAVMSEGVRGHK